MPGMHCFLIFLRPDSESRSSRHSTTRAAVRLRAILPLPKLRPRSARVADLNRSAIAIFRMSPEEKIDALEAEVKALRVRIRELEEHAGSSAERWVAALVGGTRTTGLASFDITSGDGVRFEVKFSRLNIPSKSSNSRRWSWGHPLGTSGGKTFDRLILVGEVDDRFKQLYADPSSPYVLFDIPFSGVVEVMRKDPLIQITTNPKRNISPERAASLLFGRYEVSPSELSCRYLQKPNKAPEPTTLPVTDRAAARSAPGRVVAHL